MAEPTDRLEVRGLSAWYGEAQALRDVDLTVGHGEVVTLVGRNGAGKTTLLRSVMGLHRHSTGSVVLDGTDVSRHNPDALGGVLGQFERRQGPAEGLAGRGHLVLAQRRAMGGMAAGARTSRAHPAASSSSARASSGRRWQPPHGVAVSR